MDNFVKTTVTRFKPFYCPAYFTVLCYDIFLQSMFNHYVQVC